MCFHQKFIITKIYKDLDSRMGFVFSASTYDVISHLIPITSMSAEVVDGGRCLFYFNIFFFIYLFAYSGRGTGEERGAPREKNESAADRDSSSPKSAIFQFLA